MRIGLNLLFLIPNKVGGTETYTIGLIHALSQIQQEHEYYLFINQESKSLNLTNHPKFHIVVCPIQAKYRAVRFLWEQIVLPWQVFVLRLDILHSLGYISPLVLPCKSVVTIHDLNFVSILEAFSWLNRVGHRFFVTNSAKRANHILTDSGFGKDEIVSHLKIAQEKISVTYAAPKVRQPNVQSDSQWLLIRQRLGIQKPYILAFSSLAPHKNISRLLEAFAILRTQKNFQGQMVIVGHLPVRGPALNDLIHKLELGANELIITGYLPDNEVTELLSHAALFVFPSLYEGFGLPVVEAMAAGVPVVCSSHSSLPEIAGDAAIFFDPLNTQEIVDVIMRIFDDEVSKQQLRERGWQNLQRFSWLKTARGTLDVYERVMLLSLRQ